MEDSLCSQFLHVDSCNPDFKDGLLHLYIMCRAFATSVPYPVKKSPKSLIEMYFSPFKNRVKARIIDHIIHIKVIQVFILYYSNQFFCSSQVAHVLLNMPPAC